MQSTGHKRAKRAIRTLPVLLAALAHPYDPARASNCQRSDFEAVVGETATALRELNRIHRPEYQQLLRQLRDKRGWTQSQFLNEAAPLVQDDHIGELDRRSSDLLSRIETMGGDGARLAQPDCARLGLLRQAMTSLLEVQTSKWRYMFDKLNGELAK